MNSKHKYNTKARQEIEEFFRNNTAGHVTAGQIAASFEEKGKPIALATIYRQLDGMVTEGILNKYVVDSSMPACYEYSGCHLDHTHQDYLHCRCIVCGKLIHLAASQIKPFQDSLHASLSFRLDTGRTVLYGTCQECQKKENNR